MVKVTEILRRVMGSVDIWVADPEYLWYAMINKKTRDSSFWQLCDVIPREGFRYPICIQVMPDQSWRMGNGHHRFIAALFLVLDEIPVVFSDEHDFMCGWATDPDGTEDVPGAPRVAEAYKLAQELMLA